MDKIFDVIVVGGGHAGVEASMAAARMGCETCMITIRRDGIGQMSCNPAIGGLGKGQIVKEVDGLGGLMGRVCDDTAIQFRTLNLSKGPAVRSSRAQCDRDLYKSRVLFYCENQQNLEIVEGEVASISVNAGQEVTGIVLADGSIVHGRAVVVTTGTFLRGLMHCGTTQVSGGRHGDSASNSLSDSLKSLGFTLGRLKTGTPPRLKLSSINFSSLVEQPGESPIRPFSFMSDGINRNQISCWMTETNEAVHELIRSNRQLSPMFNGQIKSGGPRYCPSIEDKVFRFADKSSHQIFLEPEGFKSDIVYPNGISTSLPAEAQEQFVRMIKGLENVEILRPGYAVEYDFVDPRCLRPTLETKDIRNLYFAGQINGTSGYEEAAGQGIIAGANAALRVLELDPLIIHRSEGYIGVMIDDLTINGVDEPYRMFTSRAEYRLVLREDNAWLRMGAKAKYLGLLSAEHRDRFERRRDCLNKARSVLESTRVMPTEAVNRELKKYESAEIKDAITLATLLRRPEFSFEKILEWQPEISAQFGSESDFWMARQLETEIKFAGYLERQEQDIRRIERSEHQKIPFDFEYGTVKGLSVEVREKLIKVRPNTVGQAMRIPGVTPAALSLLSIYLKRQEDSRTSM